MNNITNTNLIFIALHKDMNDITMELFNGTFLPICPLEEIKEKETE